MMMIKKHVIFVVVCVLVGTCHCQQRPSNGLEAIEHVRTLLNTMLQESSLKLERGSELLATKLNVLDKASSDIHTALAAIQTRINATTAELEKLPARKGVASAESEKLRVEIADKEAWLLEYSNNSTDKLAKAKIELSDLQQDEQLLSQVLSWYLASQAMTRSHHANANALAEQNAQASKSRDSSGSEQRARVMAAVSALVQTHMALTTTLPEEPDSESLDWLISQLRLLILRSIQQQEQLIASTTRDLAATRDSLHNEILDAKAQFEASLSLIASIEDQERFWKESLEHDHALLASATALKSIAQIESSGEQHEWNFQKQRIQRMISATVDVTKNLDRLQGTQAPQPAMMMK